MALRDAFLKIDSDGAGNVRLVEMNANDKIRIAALAGEHFAKHRDSLKEGYLASTMVQTGNADSVGHFTDTFYADAGEGDSTVGATLTTIDRRFKIQTSTYGGVAAEVPIETPNADGNKPLLFNTGNSPHRLDEVSFSGAGYSNNQKVANFLDEIISNIFNYDLPGTYVLEQDSDTYEDGLPFAGPDSDRWNHIYKVDALDSDQEDSNLQGRQGHSIKQKIQFVPSSNTAAWQTITNKKAPLIYANMTGVSFDGVKGMSDSEVGALFGSAIGRRIAYNQLNDGVGKMIISATNPGVDYKDLGGFLNSNWGDSVFSGTATFAGSRPATFAGSRIRCFSGVRPGVLGNPTFFTAPFSGNFCRVTHSNFGGAIYSNFTNIGTFGVLGQGDGTIKYEDPGLRLYVKIA